MSKYQGAVMLKNGDPIEALRLGGGSLSLSSATGEFNANDKRDLMGQIGKLMTAMASGEVVPGATQGQSLSSAQMADVKQARREALAAAQADPEKWASLGASVATKIQEQRSRESFMRSLASGQSLRQGEIARVTMPTYDAVAIVATSSADVAPQYIRARQFFPVEFENTVNLRVESLEIEQVSADLLDQAYNQGLEVLGTGEDRLWKKAADKTVGLVNPLQYISGQLTPNTFGLMRADVGNWNLPVTTAVIANDFWADIIGNTDFHSFLDPVTKYDLVLNGQLGTLVGLNLITDAFRAPNQKVLNRGEIYVLSSPEYHAAYTDRGGVRSTPTSGADQGNTTKGWLLSEIISFLLANPRSVSKGKRI